MARASSQAPHTYEMRTALRLASLALQGAEAFLCRGGARDRSEGPGMVHVDDPRRLPVLRHFGQAPQPGPLRLPLTTGLSCHPSRSARSGCIDRCGP